MRTFGILLVVAGILSLLYGGFSYTREKTVVDLGPIEAKVDQKHHVNIPPIAGTVALLSGLALIASDRRKNA